MSLKRLPEEVTMLLLTLFYQDGFCTIQATWDEANIAYLKSYEKCVLCWKEGKIEVYVNRTEASQKIPSELVMKIAKRWMEGDYVRVEMGLDAGIHEKDWMS